MRMEFAAAALAALFLAGCAREESAPSGDSLLIAGARLVDPVTGAVSAPKDILIEDGKIAAVENAGAVERGRARKIVDGDGLFMLPGLIDVHAHIGDGGMRALTEQDRIVALNQFVRYGVTTIFAPGGTGGNDEDLAAWKRRCGAKEFVCPRVFGSGDLITAPGSHPIGTVMEFPPDAGPAEYHAKGVVALAENDPVEPLIDRKVAAGVDAIKIVIEDGPGPWRPRPRLSKEKVREIVEASHARGLRVFAHISLPEHIDDAVAAGVDGVMHSAIDPISDQTLKAMAARQVFYVATLALHDGLMAAAGGVFPDEPYAEKGAPAETIESVRAAVRPATSTAAELAEWKAGLQSNLRRVRDAGAPLALGTDVNNPSVYPGYSAHEELALMVEAGLSPGEALNAATTGGASFLEREKEIGRIAPGYAADLIAVSANPLENILNTRRLVFVIHGGDLSRDVVSAD